MKKHVALLCATMMCVCCLALAACGGSSAGSSSATQSSSSATESAAAADPSEKFIGDWKLAAAEMQDITVVGDFSAGILGEEMSVTLTIGEGGTGSMAFNDESTDLTWEQKDDDTITITPQEATDDIKTVDVTYEDEVLSMALNDDEFSGDVYLSKNGKIEGLHEIDASNATDITAMSDLVGTWKLSGMNMMGMSMYGDADELAAIAGDSTDTAITIEPDGSATVMGTDVTVTADSSGASIDMDGTAIPLKSLDGDLLLDISEVTGDYGVDMVMLFSK